MVIWFYLGFYGSLVRSGRNRFIQVYWGFQQQDMDNKPPWQLLGEEFVRQYYQVFDTNREQLVALYAVRVKYFALGNLSFAAWQINILHSSHHAYSL